jgi:hypothetical protein
MLNEKGYALIEFMMEGLAVGGLVVVLSLICLQSTIAASTVVASRTEARFEAMRWDLLNVSDRQALYFADRSSFASSPNELRFVGTEGVVVSLTATPEGWAGTASHEALGQEQGCAIFFGSASAPTNPVRPVSPGEVVCTE